MAFGLFFEAPAYLGEMRHGCIAAARPDVFDVRLRFKRDSEVPGIGAGERLFRRLILGVTILAVAVTVGTFTGRDRLLLGASQTREQLMRLVGLEPDRAAIEEQWQKRRQLGVKKTRDDLMGFYGMTTDAMRELFRVVGMDPNHGLIRCGRADAGFLISSQVFEPDERGRKSSIVGSPLARQHERRRREAGSHVQIGDLIVRLGVRPVVFIAQPQAQSELGS